MNENEDKWSLAKNITILLLCVGCFVLLLIAKDAKEQAVSVQRMLEDKRMECDHTYAAIDQHIRDKGILTKAFRAWEIKRYINDLNAKDSVNYHTVVSPTENDLSNDIMQGEKITMDYYNHAPKVFRIHHEKRKDKNEPDTVVTIQ